MHPALRPRRRALLLAALLVSIAGCASVDPKTRLETLRAHGTPTLEEIFLLPGIQGRSPRAEELSADGRWVFFHFNPLTVGVDGTHAILDEHSLRVQSTLSPQTTNFVGLRIDDLLPRPAASGGAKPAKRADPAISLSHRGARALARRDKDVFLLDAPSKAGGSWSVRTLLHAQEEGDLKQIDSARFAEDDSAVLVESDKDLWRFPLDPSGEQALPLSAADGTNLTVNIEAECGKLTFSRDLRVVFGRDPAVSKIEVPATDSAPASQTPAQILWRESLRAVALAGMEEFKSLERSSLSPDGRFLFASVEYRKLELEPTLIPDYLSPRVSTKSARRELADDGPAPRKLFLWNTETGERTSLDLGDGDVFWLGQTAWAPQPTPESPPRLLLARTSEDFRTLETFLWSEAKGVEKAYIDRDERWIGGPVNGARWIADGTRLIFPSESLADSTLPGHAQLFSFDVATGAVRQLTKVSGEVSYFNLARDGGLVFNYCNADATEVRKLAYVAPSGAIKELDSPSGFNSDPLIAEDSGLVVFQNSRLFQPAELWSIDATSPQPAQILTRTAPAEFTARDWIHPASFEVVGERQAKVHSHVFLPRSSSLEHPDRARACIVFIHGAGFLQNVTDSMTEYPPNLLFHSRLAGLGYVVVDVDYRGSEGYGQDFRTAVQNHLGGLELKDIDATLDQLAARGVIDAHRVACYGGSYGGFLTLMALFTEGDRWSAGAALRSVTDWRTYTPGYTQPRLGRPSTNPDAYALSSPIDHVEGLTKPLLLLHGLMDDNVFAQDTIRLMEKLIELGKDFEVMLYPSQKHAFTDGAHWLDEYKRIERFLTEHLGLP